MTDTKRDRIIELHRDGRLTLAEIGTVVGVVRQTVWSILARNGALVTVPTGPRPIPITPIVSPEEAGSRKLLEAYARYYENHVKAAGDQK